MVWLVITGTLTTLIGLIGLGFCIRTAAQIKRMEDKDAAKSRLHGLVALNLGSVAVSGLGLALVVVGLIL